MSARTEHEVRLPELIQGRTLLQKLHQVVDVVQTGGLEGI